MSPLLKKNTHNEKYQLRKYCLISGILAACIMYFTLMCHGNTLAFGDGTVLRMDLYHQYGPLYAELYDRITNGYSLVYSWTSGLGGPFLGNFFNYCCSPFALVMLLFGHKNMPEAIAVMMLLNAVFSAVSFTYYINKTNKSVNRLSIGFGLFYAFCGYFVAYSWNIMWLDAMSVFPLVILGIEKIIDDRKPGLYIFAMTYTMITNYYMAYMVCLLSILYFLFRYFSEYEAYARLPGKNTTVSIPADAVTEDGFEDISSDVPAEGNIPPASPAVSLPRNNVFSVPVNGFVPDPTMLKTDGSAAEQTQEDAAAENVSADTLPAEPVGENDTAAPSAADAVPADAACSAPAVPSAGAPELSAPAEAPLPENSTGKKKKKNKEKLSGSRFWVTGWTFALASVLCFFISAFALLPVWYCLQSSSATTGSFPATLKVYFNLFDFAANHLPSLTTTIRSSGDIVLPNIYCGLLTVMLMPLYFFSKRISGRRKIAAVSFIALFYLSFSLNYLNFIWHGMHMPNDLPFRYSFAYSFILLLLAYKVLLNIDEYSNRVYVGIGVAVIGFVILLDEIDSPNVSDKTIVMSAAFAVIYPVIFGLLRSRKFDKGAIASLLIIAVVTEICLANTSNYVMEQPKENYVSDYDDYKQIAQLSEADETELFYRTELSKLRARMDPCWFGYNGVSTFSSMAYESVAKLMDEMGMFGNVINSYTYYPQTPIFNSMFALKYIYDNSDIVKAGDCYSLVAANDSYNSYKYEYYLPLAFAVNNGILDWDRTSEDPFEVQNELMSSAAGIDDILIPVEATDVSTDNIYEDVSVFDMNDDNSFSVSKANAGSDGTVDAYIAVPEDGNYYIFTGSRNVSTITVMAEDYEYSYSSSSSQAFTLDLGTLPKDSEIHVKYSLTEEDSADIELRTVRLDKAAFEKAYNAIKKNGLLELDSFDETSFSGKITVSGTDKLLYTSIPYDESWSVTIDGEKLGYSENGIVKVGDALMGVHIEPGEHTVAFRYNARGLSTGLKMTALGIVILGLYILWEIKFSDAVKNRYVRKQK